MSFTKQNSFVSRLVVFAFLTLKRLRIRRRLIRTVISRPLSSHLYRKRRDAFPKHNVLNASHFSFSIPEVELKPSPGPGFENLATYNLSPLPTQNRDHVFLGRRTNWGAFKAEKPGQIKDAIFKSFPLVVKFDRNQSITSFSSLKIKKLSDFQKDYLEESIEDLRFFSFQNRHYAIGNISTKTKMVRPIIFLFKDSSLSSDENLKVETTQICDERLMGPSHKLNNKEKNWVFYPDSHSEELVFSPSLFSPTLIKLGPSLDFHSIQTRETNSCNGMDFLKHLSCPSPLLDVFSKSLNSFIGCCHFRHTELKTRFPISSEIMESLLYSTFFVEVDDRNPYFVKRCVGPIFFEYEPKSFLYPFQLGSFKNGNNLQLSVNEGDQKTIVFSIDPTQLRKMLAELSNITELTAENCFQTFTYGSRAF